MLLLPIALSLFLLSLYKKSVIVAWISVILFFSLGFLSFNIEQVFCDYDTNATSWSCHTHRVSDFGLAYFNFGLGLVSLVYAIITSLTEPIEFIQSSAREI